MPTFFLEICLHTGIILSPQVSLFCSLTAFSGYSSSFQSGAADRSDPSPWQNTPRDTGIAADHRDTARRDVEFGIGFPETREQDRFEF
jgi:hypothetical protein